MLHLSSSFPNGWFAVQAKKADMQLKSENILNIMKSAERKQ